MLFFSDEYQNDALSIILSCQFYRSSIAIGIIGGIIISGGGGGVRTEHHRLQYGTGPFQSLHITTS